MKCANVFALFAIGLLAALPAAAEAPPLSAPSSPTVSVPAAPAVPGVKEVMPAPSVGSPSAAIPPNFPTAINEDEEDTLNIPPPSMGSRPGALAGVAGVGATGLAPTPGAGATPPGAAIPSAVTDVVGDLKRAEKNVSLEDVARAQDALARLDLLLDIEKKINEIEKVREDRKNIGKSFSRDSGMGQIPASALSLPLGSQGGAYRPNSAPSNGGIAIKPAASVPAATASPAAAAPSASGYKVEQITGGNGRYRAVVSDSGGKKSTVAEGEKLGAFTVSKISATGVTLTNAKDRKVLTVESDGVPLVVRAR